MLVEFRRYVGASLFIWHLVAFTPSAWADFPVPTCFSAGEFLQPVDKDNLSNLSRREQLNVEQLFRYMKSDFRGQHLAVLRTKWDWRNVLDKVSVIYDMDDQACRAYAVDEGRVVEIAICGSFIVEPRPLSPRRPTSLVFLTSDRKRYLYLRSTRPFVKSISFERAKADYFFPAGYGTCLTRAS